MDDKNQILDVTYGKFSCRLEGFEDSVETMKLVVSFFHDMAGHDRFMDTAPLVPDMETLARLTEEQTGQSVDIEATEQKVSLRVRSDQPDEEADLEDDAPAFDVMESAPQDMEMPVQSDDYVEDEPTDDLSNVADRLKRMRAAAERKRPPSGHVFAEDLREPAPKPKVNPLSQRLSELAKRTVETEQSAVDVALDETPAHDPHFEDVAEIDDLDDEMIAKDDTPEADDIEDINVFSNFAADDDAFDAEMPAEDEALAAEDDMEPVAKDEAPVVEDEAPAAEMDDAAPEEEIAELAPSYVEDTLPVDAVADFEDADDDEDLTVDAELEAFLAEEDEALAHAAEEETIADDEMEAFEAAAEDVIEEEVAEEEPVTEVAEAEVAPKPQESPLVLTSDDKADDDDDDYNDDDEFDLEKEVAKVEAEIAARKGNEFARRGLPRHVEDAMSRIMSQTDRHLNQPENRRHRDAFAQLKAAVAATEAARQLGDKGADKRDPDEIYKDDLGAHDALDKGEGKSSPPLKLVKSQEIEAEADDQEDSAPAQTPPAPSSVEAEPASARLRQIATQIEAGPVEDNGGFAEFAASHGATDLADQLEAAGAYICLVEGENDFSRPQVMKIVQSVSDAEISREDGLRSFGRLLRQARLVKLANGRFQVTENTQFRPDGHRAAQG